MITETTIQKGVEKASKFINIIGILAIVLGIIAIAYPLGFGKVTATVIGFIFIIGGVLRFIFAIFSVTVRSSPAVSGWGKC